MRTWIIAGTLSIMICVPTAAEKAAKTRPNIVVLFADDMGYTDLGCYGSEIQTPNLDRLATNGLRFSHFYNTGRCCPSRASILTGLYPHQANVGHMLRDTGVKGYRDHLSFDAVTIAEVLRASGYRTMMSGKWHLGWRDEGAPNARGFDRFYGTRGFVDSYFTVIKRTEIYLDDRMLIPITETPKNHLFPDREWYTTDVFTDYALHFMDEALELEKPFFMYLAYNAPHFPLHCRAEDLKKYRGKYKEIGWGKLRRQRYERLVQEGLLDSKHALSPRDSPSWDSLGKQEKDELDLKMALYAGIVDRLDQNVGRVIDKLRETGQLDNTLIMFLSDNGGTKETGLHGIKGRDANVDNYQTWARKGGWTSSYGQGWANLSNVPFRLYKRFNHEGGISTPLIVHWPMGLSEQGKVTHQVGHLVDIMATCVDVAQADYPRSFRGHTIQPMEGRSLKPVFEGKPLGDRTLYWEHEGNRAVRRGDWKLVGLQGQPWELYDMSVDRSELKNKVADQPAQASELEELWKAWAKRVHVVPPEQLRKRKPQPRKPVVVKRDPSNLATLARPRFSTKRIGRDQDTSIQDGELPQKSSEKNVVHRSWWPQRGNVQWAQYEFDQPQTLRQSSVYWFHDHPNGGCKVPAEWRLVYRDGEQWKPVVTDDSYDVAVDRLNKIRFQPISTNAIRLEVQLQEDASAGIYEWRLR